jgi:MFS family permease
MSNTAAPESAEGTYRRPQWRKLLRNRDYILWLLGDTVSNFGSVLSAAAYPMLILFVTGSAAQACLVAAAESLGMLFTLLIGGVIADRYQRRTILTYGPLVQAVAVATIVWAVLTGHVTVILVAVVGLLQGLVSGLTMAAFQPTVRRLVPAAELPTAFAQMTGRTQAVRLIGPAIGGLLFSVARWIPFLVDSISFFASTASVAALRTPLGPDQPTAQAKTGSDNARPVHREPFLRALGTGVRFIRGNGYLVFITVWTAVINACLGAMIVLTIVLVVHRGGGATAVGVTNSVGAVGGLIGAATAGRITKFGGRSVVLVLSWVVVGAFVGISLAPVVFIGGFRALLGLLIVPLNVILMSYEMRVIPDELTGRVTSTITFLAYSLTWLGPAGAGFLTSTLGAPSAGLIVAGVLLVLAIASHFVKSLHLLDRPLDEVPAGGPRQ